eukprot:829934_1
MLTQLFAVLLMVIVSNGDLSCNGVEYTTDKGAKVQYPAGVCISGNSGSIKFECNDNSMKQIIYDTHYCSGDALGTINFDDCLGNSNCKTLCRQKPCEYIQHTEYDDVISCDPLKAEKWNEITYIAGECNSLYQEWTCNSTHVIEELYENIDCNGQSIKYTYEIGDECDISDNSSNSTFADRIICGTAQDSASLIYSVLSPFICVVAHFIFQQLS